MTNKEIMKEMEARGISRKQLSQMANVSQGTLSLFFNGKANISSKTLERITQAVFSTSITDQDPEFNPRYSHKLIVPAAKALGVSPEVIRQRIQRGEVEWGSYLGEKRKLYMIDRKCFFEKYKIILDVPERKVRAHA